jgi:hypothetical protein
MTQFVKAFRELSYALGFIHDCVSIDAAAAAARRQAAKRFISATYLCLMP